MEELTIYALGSVISGKNLFFDILNIKFTEQEDLTKFYSTNYSYKGKEYRYHIYFILGSFEEYVSFPIGVSICDAVIFLSNPLIEDEFLNLEKFISEISDINPKTLIAVIMHNVFGEIDNLTPFKQETAIINGEMLCEIENDYNIKLFSLNYSLNELQSLESGDPTIQFKFFKLFNDSFYEIIHECIERRENPEKKTSIKLYEE